MAFRYNTFPHTHSIQDPKKIIRVLAKYPGLWMTYFLFRVFVLKYTFTHLKQCFAFARNLSGFFAFCTNVLVFFYLESIFFFVSTQHTLTPFRSPDGKVAPFAPQVQIRGGGGGFVFLADGGKKKVYIRGKQRGGGEGASLFFSAFLSSFSMERKWSGDKTGAKEKAKRKKKGGWFPKK